MTSDTVGPKQPFVDLEDGSLVTLDLLKDLRSQSTYFRSFSYHDFPRDSETYQNKINIYTFLLNGVWTRARAEFVDGN